MRLLFFCFAFLLFSAGTTNAQANFSIAGRYCVDAELTFNGSAADSWDWDFGDGSINSTVQNPQHAYEDSGTYKVILNCTTGGVSTPISKTFYISLNPKSGFIADSTSVSYSSYTRLFIDTSTFYSNAETYDWNFGDGNSFTSDTTFSQHKFSAAGTYKVLHKVTDVRNCTHSDSALVVISDIFFVPNVFTPNGDPFNDQFIVTSNGVTLFSIDIYSRWGNLVFHRSGVEQIVWDGTLPNGTPVKPGTYYYVITAQNGNVNYEPQAGFVTVFY